VKRFILWSAVILFVQSVVVILALRLRPWPSVAIMTYMFSNGDQALKLSRKFEFAGKPPEFWLISYAIVGREHHQ
jgi:hypothetical protein